MDKQVLPKNIKLWQLQALIIIFSLQAHILLYLVLERTGMVKQTGSIHIVMNSNSLCVMFLLRNSLRYYWFGVEEDGAAEGKFPAKGEFPGGEMPEGGFSGEFPGGDFNGEKPEMPETEETNP